MKLKTTLTLVTTILAMASLVHLFRVLNDWKLIIGTYPIPNWVSIIGIVVPAILAFYLIKIKREL